MMYEVEVIVRRLEAPSFLPVENALEYVEEVEVFKEIHALDTRRKHVYDLLDDVKKPMRYQLIQFEATHEPEREYAS